jgi:hypothetical protein
MMYTVKKYIFSINRQKQNIFVKNIFSKNCKGHDSAIHAFSLSSLSLFSLCVAVFLQSVAGSVLPVLLTRVQCEHRRL